jgi:hypothetical protein
MIASVYRRSVLRSTPVAGGDDLVDVEPVSNESVRVVPLVNDNAVVHHVGGRTALNVNLDGSRAPKFIGSNRRDHDMLVIAPIQLILPPNSCRSPKWHVAGALELDVLGDQFEESVKIAVVMAIDVYARELTWSGHFFSPFLESSAKCACSARCTRSRQRSGYPSRFDWPQIL